MRVIFLLLALIMPTAALAQGAPQYPVTYSATDVIGDGSTPNGGTPPGWASRPPAFNETVPSTGWVTGGANYTVNSDAALHEAKARFTCNAALIGVYDPIRGPGQQPFGHGHEFFGNTHIAKGSTYTSLRQQPDSTCPGGPLNGSGYWMPWPYKSDVFAPGHNLVKKFNLVTLYYVCSMQDGNFANCAKQQPFVRGFQQVFGMNMDDPDETAMRATIQAQATAHPELGIQVPGPAHGRWGCLGADGSGTYDGRYSGSPSQGSMEQPSLANLDGTETMRCPAANKLELTLDSYSCWDGRLTSAGGYAHMMPAVLFSSDGRYHCPVAWFRLPRITVIFRFSHNGWTDYRTWKCTSDAAAGAAAGRTMRACESTHTDYQFGWNETWSNKWQANCLNITINGVPGTAADCDYSTVSSTERLVSDGAPPNGKRPLQVTLTNDFKGDKVGDWFVPTPAQQGPFQGHAGMAH